MQDRPTTPNQALSLLFKHAKSPAMRRVLTQLQRCARVRLPILLRGETGSGKDLVAQAIHAIRDPGRPLVTLNCGAIPERLAESELFGHKKGAFTGASEHRRGVFERAGSGCVFLDELGELPLELQPKLLVVLENRRYLPVGAEKERLSQCSLIAATHRPLETWVQKGRFREDLLYRLNILSLVLPPLRERREDLPSLIQHFADQAATELEERIQVLPCAPTWARAQPWPGNLRQLRNLVLRCAILHGGVISQDTLHAACASIHHISEPRADALTITRSSYAAMRTQLLQDAMERQGSLRLAAQALDVPKSTLAGWIKKTQPISKTG